MDSLGDIMNALGAMPEEERQTIIEEADGLVADQVWIPNPGPQTEAYYCEADELFYGGEAGGGKSALIVGLSQTEHEKSLILRRYRDDAKALAEEELLGKILGNDRKGWNGADLIYRGGEKITTFGGCQNEDDKQRYKGKPHDLKCVEKGTPVLMADGQYRAIESLQVGDSVQTLEGPRKVERVYPKQAKQCVEVLVKNESGEVVARQVQSSTHKLLSNEDDRAAFCEPTPGHEDGSTSILLARQSSIFSRLLSGCARYFSHKAISAATSLGHRQSWGRLASCWQSIQETGCESSWDRNAAAQQHLLSSCLQAPLSPFRLLALPFVYLRKLWRGVGDAPLPTSPVDLWGYCSSGLHLCGERTRQYQGLSSGLAGVQQYPRLQPDAALPSPSYSPAGAQAGIQTHSPANEAWYVHPYTKEIRRASGSCRLHSQSCVVSNVGMKEVYDLQIEEVRHYITKGGFVNQNCFDEITDFLESQYLFITAWNRSTTPGQRCRIVCTGNPPTNAEGLWVIRRWAAWLDPRHPNPAKSGEIRWFIRDDEDNDIEVEGPGDYSVGEHTVQARSRTFIRAGLSDNPDLAADGQYEAMLSGLPKELRDAYRDGKFDVALKDKPYQVIPTSWIQAAMARWTPKPPEGVPMCAMGVDVAQGGDDQTVLAPRYDAWFDEITAVSGKQTPNGKTVAGLVVANRRDSARIIIDMGGGYGGAAYEQLSDNGIDVVGYKGSNEHKGRTKDRQLKFFNKRAAAYWKLREALDPDQPGGSDMALPNDPELMADLTAPTFEVVKGKIKVEPKDKVCDRIGRSPDKGDAVVMAWVDGVTGGNIQGGWKAAKRAPKVVMSGKAQRRRRR